MWKTFFLRENVLLGMRLVEVKTLQRVQETFLHHEGKKLADIQVGFRKGRGTRGQIVDIHWITQKSRELQNKKRYFCFIDYTKTFNCVDHNKLENSSRDGGTRPPHLPPEKSVCKSRNNSLNRTWNNRLVPNWERSMSGVCTVTLLI